MLARVRVRVGVRVSVSVRVRVSVTVRVSVRVSVRVIRVGQAKPNLNLALTWGGEGLAERLVDEPLPRVELPQRGVLWRASHRRLGGVRS